MTSLNKLERMRKGEEEIKDVGGLDILYLAANSSGAGFARFILLMASLALLLLGIMIWFEPGCATSYMNCSELQAYNGALGR